MSGLKACRHAAARKPRTTPLATEHLEPRSAPVSLAPTVLEQVFMERVNDLRMGDGRTPLAIDARMQGVAVRAAELAFDSKLVSKLKAALSKARVSWDPKDSITTGAFGSFIPADPSPSAITQMAEELAHSHTLAGSLGSPKYNRHRMVGAVVLGPDDPRNPYRDLGLTTVADVTASIKGRFPIVTGVAYRDANANSLYDAGEGLTGVQVRISGPKLKPVSVQAWDTGGFALPVKLSKQSTVTVTASGGELDMALSQTVQLRPGANARVNFVLLVPQTSA